MDDQKWVISPLLLVTMQAGNGLAVPEPCMSWASSLEIHLEWRLKLCRGDIQGVEFSQRVIDCLRLHKKQEPTRSSCVAGPLIRVLALLESAPSDLRDSRTRIRACCNYTFTEQPAMKSLVCRASTSIDHWAGPVALDSPRPDGAIGCRCGER